MASSSSRGAFGGGRDVEYDPKNPHAGRPSSAASARALMQQKSKSHWATQQAQRRQMREQEGWRDNLDRSDDPIYHRTFDDGSMHLVSSKFRDGKPVDNHGASRAAHVPHAHSHTAKRIGVSK